MIKKITVLIAAVSLLAACSHDISTICSQPFTDIDGRHINAHGGAVVQFGDTYYWYGENRPDGSPGSSQQGVACYTSPDLLHWTDRGIVLPVSDTPGAPLERGGIIERPKVVFCSTTGKYVMWFHHELKGRGYGAAHAAVAVADDPVGPFTLLRTGRVNAGVEPLGGISSVARADTMEWWTPQWREQVEGGMFVRRDLDGGQMSRDMTIFVDDDGRAYHIYSSEENLTIHVAELDSTYTRHTGRYARVAPGGHNEAPAVFRHGGRYWMITSGCTGWAPNAARLMSAENIMGPWTAHGNLCRGEGADTTYGGQSTWILPLDGGFVFMADIWKPEALATSGHLWLPVLFDSEGIPYIDNIN